MDNRYTYNGIPIFDGQDGQNYEMCNIRIKTFLQEHGFYVSQLVVTWYTTSKKLKTTSKKELKRNNKISIDFILEGLRDVVKEKVGQNWSTKELWDNIHNISYKETPLIIEPEHVDQDEEDTETEQKERWSSCHTDPKQEYCEVGVVDIEVELISALSELRK